MTRNDKGTTFLSSAAEMGSRAAARSRATLDAEGSAATAASAASEAAWQEPSKAWAWKGSGGNTMATRGGGTAWTPTNTNHCLDVHLSLVLLIVAHGGNLGFQDVCASIRPPRERARSETVLVRSIRSMNSCYGHLACPWGAHVRSSARGPCAKRFSLRHYSAVSVPPSSSCPRALFCCQRAPRRHYSVFRVLYSAVSVPQGAHRGSRARVVQRHLPSCCWPRTPRTESSAGLAR